MIPRFLTDSAVYALPALVTRGVALLLFPLFARVFSPADYGIIDIVTAVSVLAGFTVALEIAQGLGRLYVDAGEEAKTAYASTALWFTIVAFGVFAAVCVVLADPLTDLVLGHEVRPSIMIVVAFVIWATGVQYLLQSQLRWQLRPKAVATTSLASAAVTFGVSATLVLGTGSGVIGVFYAQLAGACTGIAIAAALSRGSYTLRFDSSRLAEMLRYSVPLVPASVGVFAGAYADRLVIKSSMTLADVGLYGAGFRVASLVSLLLVGFQAALTPLVLSRHAREETPMELARAFRYFLIPGLAMFAAVSALAPEILALLATPEYLGGAKVVPLLVPAVLLSGMYIFAPGMNIRKRTGIFAIITIAGGLANVALAVALVPWLGIVGAGVALLASSAGTFAAQMAVSQRLYRTPHEWGRIAGAAAIVAGTVAATAVLSPEGVGSPAAVLAKVAAAVAAVGAAAACLLRPEELARLRRRLAGLRSGSA